MPDYVLRQQVRPTARAMRVGLLPHERGYVSALWPDGPFPVSVLWDGVSAPMIMRLDEIEPAPAA